MAKITTISKEQAAKFGEWSKQWIEIGLSTEPADFDRATAAALEAYKLCNLEKPMVILRMGSPYAATLGGVIALAMLREISKNFNNPQVRSQVESQVGSQVESQVGSQVESQVGSQVESQVESQVWSQVGSQVESQVRSQVESQVRSQVRSQVGSQVWSQVRNAVYNYRGGAFWASWGAYVSFFRDVMDWQDPVLDKFKIDEELIKSCGWTWWHENVLAISDRPQSINRDEQGRLHNEVGPSISYRDGWSLYHWRGVSVPSEWIEDKKSLTAKAALTEKNVERRRAACEIVGWGKILRELSGKTIDTDEDPQIGELIEVDLPDNGPQRFLRVLCATNREFAIPVPRDMKTALQANAWTYGMDGNLFQPEVRT